MCERFLYAALVLPDEHNQTWPNERRPNMSGMSPQPTGNYACRRLASRACFLAVISLLLANSALAQLRGQVVDNISGTPVGGGFVVLIGPDGEELARTLTTRDGRFSFRLRPDFQGMVQIRSERIGYGPVVTPPFDPSRRDAADMLVRVGPLPTPLSTIEVRETSECTNRPTEDVRTAVVWEEARKALAAASWTASQRLYHVVSNIYERDLKGRRVIRERHRPSIGRSTTPFISLDPVELRKKGYVSDAGDGVVYYAPDARVLQDAGFVDTHCFRLRRPDKDRSHLIGLAFEPVPSRRLPDVEGVLWLDRQSSELRSLEYEYVNLPRDLRADDPAGGVVEFMRLPSGAWIVHRWYIGIPTAFRQERLTPFSRETSRRVEAFRYVGGEVLTVTDLTGVLVYETPLAEVVGVVVDSSAGHEAPLAGATVRVAGTWFADTTDQQGVFRLRVPLDGEYDVTFSHPRGDSLGYEPQPRSVRFARRGATDTLRFTLPPIPDIVAMQCPDLASDGRVLVGRVRDALTSDPAPGVRVVASWQRVDHNLAFQDLEGAATTDSSGMYVLCGLEHERPAIVYATGDATLSDMIRLAFEGTGVAVGGEYYETYQTSAGIWRLDLTLHRRGERTAMVTGLVTDAVGGRPIPGAVVRIGGSKLTAETDSTGMFRMEVPLLGAQPIAVGRPGYRARIGEVEIDEDRPTVVSTRFLALEAVAQVKGAVTESEMGAPLAEVWVTLVSVTGDSVTMTRTDSLGAFLLTAPSPGSYYVRARRIGHAPAFAGPFELELRRATDVALSLLRVAFALDPINVTAEEVAVYLTAVGFYRRQSASQGHFMDRTAIEKRLGGARDVTDLLTHFQGVGITDNLPGSFGAPIDLRRGVNSFVGCTIGGPLIYVDGFRIDNTQHGGLGVSGPAPAWLALSETARPEDVYGIEVYRTASQIPIEYSGPDSACGVILIWTGIGR